MAGAQCCENPPTLDPAYGAGHVADIGGLKAYLAGSPESKLAVLLASDVYGYEAPNFRKLADKVGAAGFYVIAPDFFHGDPMTTEIFQNSRDEWLKNHGPAKGFEEAKPVIEDLKNKGISAIGAAGFCWGAKVVVEFAKGDSINAAVILHPGLITLDDIKEVKCPISILGAEIDHISPPELVKQFEAILSTQNMVDYFVKIFPGVSHGWTVRYDVNDTSTVEKAEEAHKDMLDWFAKYVK
ncbi:hypothetical protein LUZ60_009203 [Juncus effusus]|nr:hypothetical protein LUZ60_009203 [Juncus effusus]